MCKCIKDFRLNAPQDESRTKYELNNALLTFVIARHIDGSLTKERLHNVNVDLDHLNISSSSFHSNIFYIKGDINCNVLAYFQAIYDTIVPCLNKGSPRITKQDLLV